MSESKKTTASKKWYEPSLPGQGPMRFAMIPLQFMLDPELENNRTAQSVFVALAMHAGPGGLCGTYSNGSYVVPSRQRLGAIAGLEVGQVSRAISFLRKKGWLKTKERRADRLPTICWITMPDRLKLVNDQGEFSALPSILTEEEVVMRKEAKLNEKYDEELGQINEATGLTLREFFEKCEAHPELDIFEVEELYAKGQANAPGIQQDNDYADANDNLVTKTNISAFRKFNVSFKSALSDVVRYHESGRAAKLYENDEIQHHGFSYETPWTELLERFEEEIQALF